jgi:hypothetical protein
VWPSSIGYSRFDLFKAKRSSALDFKLIRSACLSIAFRAYMYLPRSSAMYVLAYRSLKSAIALLSFIQIRRSLRKRRLRRSLKPQAGSKEGPRRLLARQYNRLLPQTRLRRRKSECLAVCLACVMLVILGFLGFWLKGTPIFLSNSIRCSCSLLRPNRSQHTHIESVLAFMPALAASVLACVLLLAVTLVSAGEFS